MPEFVSKLTIQIMVWSIGLLFSVGAGIQYFAIIAILEIQMNLNLMESRLLVIESNRFTTTDGRDIERMISRLEKEVAKLPKSVPPDWFKDIVYSNKKRLDEIQKNGYNKNSQK